MGKETLISIESDEFDIFNFCEPGLWSVQKRQKNKLRSQITFLFPSPSSGLLNSISRNGASKMKSIQMQESWILSLTLHWLSIKPEKRETFEVLNGFQLPGILRKTSAGNSWTCRQEFPVTRSRIWPFIRKVGKGLVGLRRWHYRAFQRRLLIAIFKYADNSSYPPGSGYPVAGMVNLNTSM